MCSFFYNIVTDLEAFKSACITLDLNKLDLFGDEYLLEHIKSHRQNITYQAYITNALKIIAENTAKFAGGTVLKHSYTELIAPKVYEEPKSADEVIADVNRKCGLDMTDNKEVGTNECI